MTTMTPPELTGQVLTAFAGTSAPRLREMLSALIKHLHAFATETSLTPQEWLAGIRFLTATGQACDEVRQEFVLLSDVLGLSSLVEMLNAASDATEATVLGPFTCRAHRGVRWVRTSAVSKTASRHSSAERSPTPRASHCLTRPSTCGRAAVTGCTTPRIRSSPSSTCAASSSPRPMAGTSSGPRGRSATRYQLTARSGSCCGLPREITGARLTSTPLCPQPGTVRSPPTYSTPRTPT
jgi:hypothetical protein